ncbi:hypothetical protein QBC37DRAFT_426077 [Rhypophila decipiens]|uniref:Protein kinase domain-containing protein n=1 Tax=Rhypophila decipiens TaxID=261697 RepID=A0AAN7B3Y0_9PEZI|nr:hypothetical protein QBC37DRAFT_426077 [Rhypophila decipiens]
MDLKHHCILPSASSIVGEFRDYIDNHLGYHLHEGIDCNNRTRKFVCKVALEGFWSLNKIREVIGNDKSTKLGRLSVDQLATSHLLIFSILCYVGSPSRIVDFTKRQVTDEHLPLRSRHLVSKTWPTTSENNPTRKLFLSWQWTFCPLIFGRDLATEIEVPRSQILPIRNITQLQEDGGAGHRGTALYRVKLYDCCKPENARSNEVVFKAFESTAVDPEARFYAEISTKSAPNLLQGVTGFCGAYVFPNCAEQWPRETRDPKESSTRHWNSFDGDQDLTSSKLEPVQQRFGARVSTTRRIIVLEYAHGGSLSRFCEDNICLMSSSIWKDRLSFWHQMFKILTGLEAAHQLGIVHRDVNETNILYSGGTSLHDIDVPCFKIADFGISKANIEQDEPAESSYLFNYVYMAPECIGHPDYRRKLPPPEKYTPSADIWALGCLFSEMLIRCSPLGEWGVAEYHRRRIAENEHTRLKGLEWAGGFHNGSSHLSCVEEMHRLALKAVPETDRGFLEIASRIILDNMLQPRVVRERLSAAEIRSLWLDEVRRLEDDKSREKGISAERLTTSDMTKSSCLHNTTRIMTSTTTSIFGWPQHPTPRLEPLTGKTHVNLQFISGWLSAAHWPVNSNPVARATRAPSGQTLQATKRQRNHEMKKKREDEDETSSNSECAVPEILSRIIVISEGLLLH